MQNTLTLSTTPVSDVENKSPLDVVKEETVSLSDTASLESGYPEGGRDAVMTLIGACLANFVQYGLASLSGALQAQ